MNGLLFLFVGFFNLHRSSIQLPDLEKEALMRYKMDSGSGSACSNIKWHCGNVSRAERSKLLNQKGCIVWFTGLSGSGKSTVACALESLLASHAKLAYVLDGDNLRHGLNKNLGFSPEDRQENIRRVGEVAKLFADAGLVTLVSFISPYKRDRDSVRNSVRPGEFIEVHMDVPLDVCEKRDCKGLYKLARDGILKGFTGIDDPYEEPENPEIVLNALDENGALMSPQRMAKIVLEYLENRGLLTAPVLNGVRT